MCNFLGILAAVVVVVVVAVVVAVVVVAVVAFNVKKVCQDFSISVQIF
jgi:hypothetical protein